MKLDQSKLSQTFDQISKDFKIKHPKCKQQQDVPTNLFGESSTQRINNTEKKRPLKNQQINGMDDMNTPKKQIKLPSQFNNSQKKQVGKIKSRYIVDEKTTLNPFVKIPMIIFILLTLCIIFGSIYAKIDLITHEAQVQKEKCTQNFVKNKCQKPLTDLIEYCKKQKLCMNSSKEELMKQKLRLGYFFGQIMKQIFDGAGYLVAFSGILLIIVAVIFGKGKHIKKEFIEYW